MIIRTEVKNRSFPYYIEFTTAFNLTVTVMILFSEPGALNVFEAIWLCSVPNVLCRGQKQTGRSFRQ